jgi:5'-AMP-activated protein kinase catalytic alpha subunit
MEGRGKILMERYELGRLLGKGTFGRVHYARNLESNRSVAIKMMDKDKVLKVGLSEQIRREITTMRLVAHKNIVELHEVMATRNKIYFGMEMISSKCRSSFGCLSFLFRKFVFFSSEVLFYMCVLF